MAILGFMGDLSWLLGILLCIISSVFVCAATGDAEKARRQPCRTCLEAEACTAVIYFLFVQLLGHVLGGLCGSTLPFIGHLVSIYLTSLLIIDYVTFLRRLATEYPEEAPKGLTTVLDKYFDDLTPIMPEATILKEKYLGLLDLRLLNWYFHPLRYMPVDPRAAGNLSKGNYTIVRVQESPAKALFLVHTAEGRPIPADSLRREIVDEDDERCVICMQAYEADDAVTIMPCSHMVHTECIAEWWKRNLSCVRCTRKFVWLQTNTLGRTMEVMK